MDCDLGSIAYITSSAVFGAFAAQRSEIAFLAQQIDLSSVASARLFPTLKAAGVLAIICHLLAIICHLSSSGTQIVGMISIVLLGRS